MLLVDDRIGSANLLGLFTPYHVPVSTERLRAGDFAWEGKGPKGSCMVAVERKTVTDLLDSLTSKRLAGHQLPELAETVDYAYLVVEGIWRADADGYLERLGGKSWHRTGFRADSVINQLMGLSLRAGMIVWNCAYPKDTVEFVVSQYRMWQTPWHEHTSHDVIYAPAADQGDGGRRLFYQPRQISVTEKMAMQIPGVGRKARGVAEHFSSPRAMATATAADWQKVKWADKGGKSKGFGKEMAEKMVRVMEGREHE